jgi:hypothetical protein
LLAGLDRGERFQMVGVPVSPAKWSTWKPYCSAAGISMGRAIAALIDRELAGAIEDSSGRAVSVAAKLIIAWSSARRGTSAPSPSAGATSGRLSG